MNKIIIHFGQDLNRAEFYNHIVKVTYINFSELSNETRDELLQRNFTIYYFDDDTIEAEYKHRYMEVANKSRDLEMTGCLSDINN